MASRKPSAKAKRQAEFRASLGGGSMDDLFAREDQRRQNMSADKEAALRKKACESKNRYFTQFDAEDAIRMCGEYGTTGLHTYKCPYCEGWHLTSKPWH